jgi:hypothetical protein
MTDRMIVGIVAFLFGSTYGMIATFVTFQMLDKFNETVSEKNGFGALRWHSTK